jgi:hypothetical protein
MVNGRANDSLRTGFAGPHSPGRGCGARTRAQGPRTRGGTARLRAGHSLLMARRRMIRGGRRVAGRGSDGAHCCVFRMACGQPRSRRTARARKRGASPGRRAPGATRVSPAPPSGFRPIPMQGRRVPSGRVPQMIAPRVLLLTFRKNTPSQSIVPTRTTIAGPPGIGCQSVPIGSIRRYPGFLRIFNPAVCPSRFPATPLFQSLKETARAD